MEKKKYFSFKTAEGSRHLFILFLALIMLFSAVARLIASDMGKVKITRVYFDARGAMMDADLYYPAGTSDEDKLPAVLIAHGGGVTNGNMKGFAEELARRGFVVLNVNGYGVGLSEQPVNDDGGQGIHGFDRKATPAGMIDALNYVRTLQFVDQTRIGMAGHSNGSRRSGYAAMMDCGYLTFNDTMLNVLYDEFGVNIAEADIYKDADLIAQENLDATELKFYEMMKEEQWAAYDTKLKSLCLIGSDAELITIAQPVEVAGHEVMRNCQVNFGIVTGMYDPNYRGYISSDDAKNNWYTDGQDVELETWYAVDDETTSSEKLGKIYETSVVDNEQLKQAIDDRTTRIVSFNRETHSKNFFSTQTTADVVKYFEQTLGYNCGELSDPATVPLDVNNSVFMWREYMNTFAMIAMVLMCIALAGALLGTRFFAPCIAAPYTGELGVFNKKKYWLIGLGSIAVAFFAVHTVNNVYGPGLYWSMFIPYFSSWWLTVIYVAIVAAGSAVLLAICWLTDRKAIGNARINALNVKMKVVNVLKTILLAVIMLAAAYGSLMVIQYLFGQDYRWWMAAFAEMKGEYWRYIWRVALLMFPTFLIIGALTNYTLRKDIPRWRDNLITVLLGSGGVWLCCVVNLIIVYSTGDLFSSFISCYGYLLLVPVTVYITRKMYEITNSIWLGAAFNSLLLSWTINTTIGLNVEKYIGQWWLSSFLNL